uniref:hypothetical protein n=1 Tax=Hassallia byssoidea TaxID=482630 RepID=UPI000693B78C|nr:hypothetical protein [Hassalia byssoidea]
MRSYLSEHNELKKRTREYYNVKFQVNKKVFIKDETLIYFTQIYKVILDYYDDRDEHEKDVWELHKLGVRVNPSRAKCTLNFTRINQAWLKEATKKYIRYRLSIYSAEKSLDSIGAINDFSAFIAYYHPLLQAQDIDRRLILEYITQLPHTGLHPRTISKSIGSLKKFLEMCAIEEWLPVPDKRLIYAEDFPKPTRGLPRYIPE